MGTSIHKTIFIFCVNYINSARLHRISDERVRWMQTSRFEKTSQNFCSILTRRTLSIFTDGYFETVYSVSSRISPSLASWNNSRPTHNSINKRTACVWSKDDDEEWNYNFLTMLKNLSRQHWRRRRRRTNQNINMSNDVGKHEKPFCRRFNAACETSGLALAKGFPFSTSTSTSTLVSFLLSSRMIRDRRCINSENEADAIKWKHPPSDGSCKGHSRVEQFSWNKCNWTHNTGEHMKNP